MKYSLPLDEIIAKCRRRANRYVKYSRWHHLPDCSIDSEDLVQSALIELVCKRNRLPEGTSPALTQKIINNEISRAFHNAWRPKNMPRKITKSTGGFDEEVLTEQEQAIATAYGREPSPETEVDMKDLLVWTTNALRSTQQLRIKNFIEAGGSYDYVPEDKKHNEIKLMSHTRKRMRQVLEDTGNFHFIEDLNQRHQPLCSRPERLAQIAEYGPDKVGKRKKAI